MFNRNSKKIGFIQLDEESMSRSTVSDLRAAIYQTEEYTQELKDVKLKMI